MVHKTIPELRSKLDEAAKYVEVGASYQHYSDPGRFYKVIGFAILEASDEVAVRYEVPEGAGLEFIRPLEEWLRPINVLGKFTPRFTICQE